MLRDEELIAVELGVATVGKRRVGRHGIEELDPQIDVIGLGFDFLPVSPTRLRYSP